MHLSQFADRLPSQLSGGQRQRMALARALAVQPKVLLLDEPFGALDAKVRKELREWLRRLHDEVPVTTVFVTHDQEEAMEVADEIVVINDGRIEQVGTPDQLYDEPANDFVMGFLGEVTQLGEVRLRPHDIEIALTPDLAGSTPADILRLTRVGFEVRLVAGTEDGQEVSVVTTRAHARAPRPRGGPAGLAHPVHRRRHRPGHEVAPGGLRPQGNPRRVRRATLPLQKLGFLSPEPRGPRSRHARAAPGAATTTAAVSAKPLNPSGSPGIVRISGQVERRTHDAGLESG